MKSSAGGALLHIYPRCLRRSSRAPRSLTHCAYQRGEKSGTSRNFHSRFSTPCAPRRQQTREESRTCSAQASSDHEERLASDSEERIRALLCDSSSEMRITNISYGYCNSVHLVERPPDGLPVVVKLYSDLSTLRIEDGVRGAVDVAVAEVGLGPAVLMSTSEGIVHSYQLGEVLSEEDIHGTDVALVQNIATMLSHFHALPFPAVFANAEPLIWSWFDKMLEAIDHGCNDLPDFVTMDELRQEIAAMRAAYSCAEAKVVLAHGDFKPSNVLQAPADSEGNTTQLLQFIDLELSGPNYRGFDIMKLFRTKLPFSEANFEAFLEEYLSASAIHEASSEAKHPMMRVAGDVLKLEAEAKAFEPLTWLEAAVFFVLVLATEADPASQNYDLGKQRWQQYLATKDMATKKA